MAKRSLLCLNIMGKEYCTIKQRARHEVVIQKSRFVGDAFYVTSEDEALERLQNVKAEFPDATHHCYAYIVGQEGLIQRFNDDGEPGGTAGMPILQVIQNRGLKNVLVVVTRYFGGIKLGANGLVRAYSRTAAEVLDRAGTKRMVLSPRGIICLDYAYIGQVEYFLRQKGVHVTQAEYTDKVTLQVVVPVGWDEFCGMLREMCGGNVEFREMTPVFHSWE
ncbi:putative YigZ family protein [Caldicoprobacter guelmensis]|uniref:YigZ family protein n=1 Tax=Caldicoprobacter guelmensis TaxID=1170224 RepID=UPI00195A2533|nr:putative YigZ family protein [Caldicoprobacter guelmensis]